jgi:hypothetical protein
MLFFLKNGTNLSSKIISLYLLLKGPTYETKAEAIRTSPMISFKSSPRSIIDYYQRSSSEPRAPTKR